MLRHFVVLRLARIINYFLNFSCSAETDRDRVDRVFFVSIQRLSSTPSSSFDYRDLAGPWSRSSNVLPVS